MKTKWFEVNITAFKSVAIEVPDDWSKDQAISEAVSEAFDCDNTQIGEAHQLECNPGKGLYDEYIPII